MNLQDYIKAYEDWGRHMVLRQYEIDYDDVSDFSSDLREKGLEIDEFLSNYDGDKNQDFKDLEEYSSVLYNFHDELENLLSDYEDDYKSDNENELKNLYERVYEISMGLVNDKRTLDIRKLINEMQESA